MSQHTFKLLGGPLDGMTLSAPIGTPVPSEIVLREVHARPFWEGLYRANPAAPWITEDWLESPVWAFRHVGASEWLIHFQWQEERIAKLEERINRTKSRRSQSTTGRSPD